MGPMLAPWTLLSVYIWIVYLHVNHWSDLIDPREYQSKWMTSQFGFLKIRKKNSLMGMLTGSWLVLVLACRVFGTKPLFELMLTQSQSNLREQILIKSISKWKNKKMYFEISFVDSEVSLACLLQSLDIHNTRSLAQWSMTRILTHWSLGNEAVILISNFPTHIDDRNLYIWNYVVSNVPADGLAPLGVRPSAGTMMNRLEYRIYPGPALGVPWW